MLLGGLGGNWASHPPSENKELREKTFNELLRAIAEFSYEDFFNDHVRNGTHILFHKHAKKTFYNIGLQRNADRILDAVGEKDPESRKARAVQSKLATLTNELRSSFECLIRTCHAHRQYITARTEQSDRFACDFEQLTQSLHHIWEAYPHIDPRIKEGKEYIAVDMQDRDLSVCGLSYRTEEWPDYKIRERFAQKSDWIHHATHALPKTMQGLNLNLSMVDKHITELRNLSAMLPILQQYQENIDQLRPHAKRIATAIFKQLLSTTIFGDEDTKLLKLILTNGRGQTIEQFAKTLLRKDSAFSEKIDNLLKKENIKPNLKTRMARLEAILLYIKEIYNGRWFSDEIKRVALLKSRFNSTVKDVTNMPRLYITLDQNGFCQQTPELIDTRIKYMQQCTKVGSLGDDNGVFAKQQKSFFEEIGFKPVSFSIACGTDQENKALLDLQFCAIHKIFFARKDNQAGSLISPYILMEETVEHLRDPKFFSKYCKNFPYYIQPIMEIRDELLTQTVQNRALLNSEHWDPRSLRITSPKLEI